MVVVVVVGGWCENVALRHSISGLRDWTSRTTSVLKSYDAFRAEPQRERFDTQNPRRGSRAHTSDFVKKIHSFSTLTARNHERVSFSQNRLGPTAPP